MRIFGLLRIRTTRACRCTVIWPDVTISTGIGTDIAMQGVGIHRGGISRRPYMTSIARYPSGILEMQRRQSCPPCPATCLGRCGGGVTALTILTYLNSHMARIRTGAFRVVFIMATAACACWCNVRWRPVAECQVAAIAARGCHHKRVSLRGINVARRGKAISGTRPVASCTGRTSAGPQNYARSCMVINPAHPTGRSRCCGRMTALAIDALRDSHMAGEHACSLGISTVMAAAALQGCRHMFCRPTRIRIAMAIVTVACAHVGQRMGRC